MKIFISKMLFTLAGIFCLHALTLNARNEEVQNENIRQEVQLKINGQGENAQVINKIDYYSVSDAEVEECGIISSAVSNTYEQWMADANSLNNTQAALPLETPVVEAKVIFLSAANRFIAQSGSVTLTVSLLNNVIANEDITVNISYKGNTYDYSLLPNFVVISAGVSSANFTISALATASEDEVLTITLSSADKYYVSIGNDKTVSVTVRNLQANDDYSTTFSCKSVEIDVTANDIIQQAATTLGTDFWLSFGQNREYNSADVTLQIKIVTTDAAKVKFTYLNTGKINVMDIPAGTVSTITLSNEQKSDVYVTPSTTGISKKTLHIQSTADISVFALNQNWAIADATNVLPANVLGKDYYHLSYKSYSAANADKDGMLLIATENGTNINVNGTSVSLNKGEIYYKSEADMTGQHITSNKPIAHFVSHRSTFVPVSTMANADILFQQMLPVHAWGKRFLVPLNIQKETVIRVLASQNGTVIKQTGGNIITSSGSKNSLNLNKGEFVELSLTRKEGCYIESNYPVAVCSYLQSFTNISTFGGPAEAWIPPLEQSVESTTVAPFIVKNNTQLTEHYALIITPTASATKTMMAIGSGGFKSISGGDWYDNNIGYSYYSLKLTSAESSYSFSNPSGLMILVYGLGSSESYYYLAGSSVSDLSNNTGSQNGTVSINLLSNPTHGTATINDSKIVYANTSCSNSTLDEFKYQICLSGKCSDAGVKVLVRSVPSIIIEDNCSYNPTLLINHKYSNATYEWQYKSSATGSNWVAVSGGNTHKLITVEQGKYRAKISCFGQEVFTDEITFTIIKQTYIPQTNDTLYNVRINN